MHYFDKSTNKSRINSKTPTHAKQGAFGEILTRPFLSPNSSITAFSQSEANQMLGSTSTKKLLRKQKFRRTYASIAVTSSLPVPIPLMGKTTVQKLNQQVTKQPQLSESTPQERLKFLLIASEKSLEIEKLRQKFTDLNIPNEIVLSMQGVERIISTEKWFSSDGKLEILDVFIEILKVFFTVFYSIANKLIQNSQKPREFKGKQIQVKVKDSPIHEDIEILSKQVGEIKEQKQQMLQYFERERRSWNIEKEQLKLKISTLEKSIRETSDVNTIQNLQKESKELQESQEKHHEKLIQQKNSQIYILQHDVGNFREELSKKNKFLTNFKAIESSLKSEIKANEHTISTLEGTIETLNIKEQSYNNEREKHLSIRDSLQKTREQLVEYKVRYKQMELDIQIGSVTSTKDTGLVLVNFDDPVFQKIQNRDHYIENKAYIYANIKENSDVPDPNEKTDLSDLDISKYKFLRPGFADFVKIMDKGESHCLPFSNWLEVTVRGIYDSKYYEILTCSKEQGKNPTRFPEFLYSWLQYYYISDEKKVETRPLWRREYANESRLEFLYALSYVKVKQLWEFQTFRDFLLEDMSFDELAFYLHCRFILFRGPQLETSAGRFSAIHYIPIDKAFELIDTFMERLYETDRNDLKQLVLAKAKKTESGMTIDSAYLLRVILEYYRNEKKSKYLAIKALFNSNKSVETGELDFFGFKSICEGLNSKLPSIELAEFYRDLWSITQGKITPDAFFLLANENCFFFKLLQLKKHWKNPQLDSNGDISPYIDRDNHIMSEVYKHFIKSHNQIKVVGEAVKRLGIPQLIVHIEKFEDFIKKKGQGDISEINGWNMLLAYRHYWNTMSSAALVYEEFNFLIDIEDFDFKIDSEVSHVQYACRSIFAKLKMLGLKERVKERSIKKIQKIWKNKIHPVNLKKSAAI